MSKAWVIVRSQMTPPREITEKDFVGCNTVTCTGGPSYTLWAQLVDVPAPPSVGDVLFKGIAWIKNFFKKG